MMKENMITHQKRRSGSTLMETMIVLTVASSVVMLAIGWIHQSFRLAGVIRNHDRHHQSVMRLSREFRDDAHVALSATLEGERLRLEMQDEEAVVYTIETESATVRRTRLKLNEEQPLSRESFALQEFSEIKFDGSESPDWVSLTVIRADIRKRLPAKTIPPRKSSDRPIDLHVRAAVGRWNEPGNVEPGNAEEQP